MESVVSIGDLNQGGDISVEYLYSYPSPSAASLSTPPPTKNIPLSIQKLLDAIDKTDLHIPSSSQQQITKSTLQQVTMESSWIVAIAQVEEVTPPVSQETQVGISSGATTTIVETTISQLDDGYIIKTPLMETTVDTIVSLPVRSPRY
ncbi:hypothetical protein Hanom_Chr02g00116421 [Helianthus anomalus]